MWWAYSILLIGIGFAKEWMGLGTTYHVPIFSGTPWSWPSLALVHMEIMQLCRLGEVTCSTMKGRPVAASCAALALWANDSNYVKKPKIKLVTKRGPYLHFFKALRSCLLFLAYFPISDVKIATSIFFCKIVDNETSLHLNIIKTSNL